MKTTLSGLLAAIIEHPEDDHLRLVYADALDDDGQSQRAEFIRLQIEMTLLEKSGHSGDGSHRRMARRGGTGGQTMFACDECERFEELVSIDHRLLLKNYRDWIPYISPGNSFELVFAKPSGNMPSCSFRRGFINEVICPYQSWLDHGPAIVRQHPVTKVVATDKKPWLSQGTGNYCWFRQPLDEPWVPSRVPDVFFLLRDQIGRLPVGGAGGLLSAYPTEQAALDALSDAMIRWAKEQKV